jgi:hypothetical protein
LGHSPLQVGTVGVFSQTVHRPFNREVDGSVGDMGGPSTMSHQILARNVVHDVNNLLAVVLGHAAMLGATLPYTDPRRGDVEAISIAAARAAEVVATLVTANRAA